MMQDSQPLSELEAQPDGSPSPARAASDSSTVSSPVTPATKPLPPSPADPSSYKTPPEVRNLYERVYGGESVASGCSDDTIPLDSPWATPGIRKKPMPKALFEDFNAEIDPKVDEEFNGEVSPVDTEAIFGKDEDAEHSESAESSAQEDDPELAENAPCLNNCSH